MRPSLSRDLRETPLSGDSSLVSGVETKGINGIILSNVLQSKLSCDLGLQYDSWL